MNDDDNIVDLNEILREKQRQKELEYQTHIAELRAQLRWVLSELHKEGATYTEEAEEQEIEYKPGWHRRLINWFIDKIARF
jgi:hypothetical protein